jgi:hypothetical protein
MDPVIARKTWRTLEPIHGAVYFAREQSEIYDPIGLHGRSGYFATRSAPMGAVATEVVVATFFNFYPGLVRDAMDGVWDRTSPDEALDARHRVVDLMMRRVLGEAAGSHEMAEAAELAQRAAIVASEHPEGRPLFAAHAELAWPDPSEPHLVLWHAQTLLREFRGDAHVALLTAAGISGCEALVIHAATGEVPTVGLKVTRAWPEEDWAAAAERLRRRGWLDADDQFTAAGRAHREELEAQTDALATVAYEALGDDGCERLRTLARPFSKAIVGDADFTLGAAQTTDRRE